MCIPPPPSLSEWEEDQQLQLEQHKSQGDGEKKELQQQQQSDGGGGGEATSPSRLTIAEIPPVSEVDARNALLGLVTEHCCWGRSAARHMSIGKILSSSAFHVKNKTTFKKIGGKFEPFQNQQIWCCCCCVLVRNPNVYGEAGDVVGFYAARRWRN